MLMDQTYQLLKVLHLTGVVIFLGNIIVTGCWKFMADRTGNPEIIAFAQRQVTLTDYLFTAGGVALVLAGGMGNVWYAGYNIPETKWLSWGVALFSLSGLIWMVMLIPLQIKLAKIAASFQNGGPIPEEYRKLSVRWNIWGTVAIILPAVNLYLMVCKPL